MVEVLLVVTVVMLGVAIMLLVLPATRIGRGAAVPALTSRLDQLVEGQLRTEAGLREESSRCREETARESRELREETGAAVRSFAEVVVNSVGQLGAQQKGQLEGFTVQLAELTQANDTRLAQLRQVVDERMRQLQEDNNHRLEDMRKTVDEKLETTLEKRLGESFRQVSERLEAVHQGLGEMQTLAQGVGDLKKVLTNVKTRGTWGEVQLGGLLEQVLTADQYVANACCLPGSSERVEYAIKLPGRDSADGAPVFLPIDAKFPVEDYQRLLEAEERADREACEIAWKQLEIRVKDAAKAIQAKYINPPHTTDFALMFIPTEGLYAEVLRRPGLTDLLQGHFRVVVAGPTTLAALLNSLQMGFRTLAIEKRSSEVWELLGAVKGEFGKFGDVLAKVQVKLHQASDTIDLATRKTRTIERRLKSVQELPPDAAGVTLGLNEAQEACDSGEWNDDPGSIV